MSRPIDADALIPKLKAIHEAENQIYRSGSWGFSLRCINAVEDAPTIVPERKKGQWVGEGGHAVGFDPDGYVDVDAWCSECGEWLTASDEYLVRGWF